jgi:hypothetical protein
MSIGLQFQLYYYTSIETQIHGFLLRQSEKIPASTNDTFLYNPSGAAFYCSNPRKSSNQNNTENLLRQDKGRKGNRPRLWKNFWGCLWRSFAYTATMFPTPAQ